MIDWDRIDKESAPETAGHELYHVRLSEICSNGFFSLCSVAEYLQESAFRNSSFLNLGMEAFQGTPLAWVLARLAIYVRHYPRNGDAVSVETWFVGLQGRFGNRFFRLRDENNMVIACALSTFALFDLEKRHIAKWPEFIEARMPPEGPCPIEYQRRKIEKPLLGMPQAPFQPRLGDLDLYNHVNNTKLIEWALSALSPDVRHPFQPKAVDVVFRNECRLQDLVQAEVEQVCEKAVSVLLKTSEGKELIRAHVTR